LYIVVFEKYVFLPAILGMTLSMGKYYLYLKSTF